MICKNCNFQIDEGDVFCPNCGCKCEEEPVLQTSIQNSMQNSTPHASQDSIEPTEEILLPCSTQYDSRENFSDEYRAEISFVPVKKKGRAGRVILAILIVLLVLAGSVAAFWKPVLSSVAPEKYMALLVDNTLDEISDETAKISKNVFGFELSPQNEFTAGMKFNLLNAYDEVDFEAEVANFPQKNKALAKGKIETDYISMPFEAFWNDEKFGAMFAGTDKKYLTVPSKNFGEEFEDSDYLSDKVGEDAEEVLSGLDLSYSNIMKFADEDSKNSKRLKKHISRNLQEFFEKSYIGERESTNYSFENGSVKAKKIAVEFETDDFYDFLIDLAEDVRADENLNEYIGDDTLKQSIDSLKDAKKESDNQDVKVEIIEYKGKIVSISFEGEIDESEYWDNYDEKYKTTISTGDKKSLLASVTILTETEYDRSDDGEYSYRYEGKDVNETIITSNWVTEDDKITLSVETSYEDKYTNTDSDGEESENEYENSSDFEFTLDFSKGKWTIDAKNTYDWGDGDKNTDKKSYDGKCSKKNGFSFSVENEWEDEDWDYSMSYDEWKADYYSDWLEEVYEENRSDYLDYVYHNRNDFYYDYDTYYDWYEAWGSVWDVPDYDFEDWLFDYEEIYYSDWDAYEQECWVSTPVDAHFNMELTLKPKADLSIKDAKHVDIFKWDEEDFEEFFQEADEEMTKEQ